MKRKRGLCLLMILVMLASVLMVSALPVCAKEGDESPPGIQKNSGWTVKGSNLYTTFQDCNVGIGTMDPSGKLEVVGDIVVSGRVDGIDLDVAIGNLTSADEDLQDAIDAEETARIAADNTLQTNINNLAAADALDYDSLADLEAAVANGFNIATTSGNVGIGTLSPSKKLHVAGSVLVDEDFEVDGDTTLSGELDPQGGIVSSDEIEIESTGDYIKLIAGDSIITIDPSGGITIESTGDITIDSKGALNLQGETVSITSEKDMVFDVGENMDIESGKEIKIDTGTKMNIKTGTEMNLDAGTIMKLNANTQLDIKSSNILNMQSNGITNIKGSIIKLNNGVSPAARVNDPVFGVCMPPGAPLVGGRILLGSNTVFIG